MWVDATAAGGAALAALRGALEDAALKKVWHNFSFDRAVLGNHGISATLAAREAATRWKGSRRTCSTAARCP